MRGLAHVGDRTGLEMIRTLQQHAVHKGIDVYMECNLQRLLTDGGRISGAFGYWRESGKFIMFKCKAVVLATGGGGKAWKVTSNSWEYTGDGVTMAADAGADLMDMEFMQFHPTGMVWPPSVRGILVTEGVRGDGGTLKNTEGERFMFNYIPDFFKAETAETERRSRRLVRGQAQQSPHARFAAARRSRPGDQFGSQSRPRHAPRRRLPRYRVAPPGRLHPASGCRRCTISSKNWPMSTSPKKPMEVGPTCHYSMGGVRVDADSTATTVPGLIRRRRSRRRAPRRQSARAATRCRIFWFSAGAPVFMRRNMPNRSPAR